MIENFLDTIDDIFCPRHYWNFYRPVGWEEKEFVCREFLTSRQAWKFANENHYLFEISLD